MRRWGLLVALAYGLILIALVWPEGMILGSYTDSDVHFPAFYHDLATSPFAWAWFAILVGGAATLLFVPVEASGRLLRPRRHLWVAALWIGGTATLLTIAALYSFLALIGDKALEVIPIQSDAQAWMLLAGSWTVWGLVFYRYTTGTEDALNRATAWLLKGSVLELLIAVPSHVIARRRGDCCAPMASGIGIATGIAVMLLTFGPSVLLLYRRRLERYGRARASRSSQPRE